MKWISVKDRWPEWGDKVIAFRRSSATGKEHYHIIVWMAQDEQDYSHWMPLPAPPKETP